MATLIELAADILKAHASTTAMTSDELITQLQKIHSTLKMLDSGEVVANTESEETKTVLTVKDAFKKNEVICMICNKGGFKTLTRHLSAVHKIKPGDYKKQFGIPAKQPLSAKTATEARRKSALDRGMGEVLAKARQTRMANIAAKKSVPSKTVKRKTSKSSK